MSTEQSDPTSGPTIVLVDAQGQVTTDKSRAVGGEILSKGADGSTISTVFDIDPPDASAPLIAP